MKRRSIIIGFLFIILTFGAYLRFEGLNRQSYWMDEGYTVNAVISQISNGTERLGSVLDSGNRYFCAIYCAPTAWIVQIFGAHPWSFRVLAGLCGVFVILLTYAVTKKFFNDQRITMLSTALVAVSYWQIAWSREARWYTMLELLFWLALFTYPLTGKKDRPWTHPVRIFFMAIFSAIAILIHPLAYLLPIILLAWFWIEHRPNIKTLTIATLGVLGFLAFAEFALGVHLFTSSTPVFSLQNHGIYYVSFYLRQYWLFIAFAIYGYFVAPQHDRRRFLLLALPFFLYLIGLAFFSSTIEYRYVFHTTLAFFILGAYGCVRALEAIKDDFWRIITGLLCVATLLAEQQIVLNPLSFYTLEADDPTTVYGRSYYAYTPQPNFHQAYATIKERIQPDDIVISSHAHFNKIFLQQPGYWLGYDYLGRSGVGIPKTQTHEPYVNASVVHDLDELVALMESRHGYIVFDHMSTDRRIRPEIIDYIRTHATLIFDEERNSYSKIWVYRF
ncbi:MAG: glycosyltransferase family 39 protein [Candidatus Uhrbacteria bacterium]|nr:glycosyltransferase family 39 protein [Candidatus Uhrbacteria bacterium]